MSAVSIGALVKAKKSKVENPALQSAERLLRVFLPERITYLVVTVVGFVVLVYATVYLLDRGTVDWKALALLFGSSGPATVAAGRCLAMWNRVVDVVLPLPNKEEQERDK